MATNETHEFDCECMSCFYPMLQSAPDAYTATLWAEFVDLAAVCCSCGATDHEWQNEDGTFGTDAERREFLGEGN